MQRFWRGHNELHDLHFCGVLVDDKRDPKTAVTESARRGFPAGPRSASHRIFNILQCLRFRPYSLFLIAVFLPTVDQAQSITYVVPTSGENPSHFLYSQIGTAMPGLRDELHRSIGNNLSPFLRCYDGVGDSAVSFDMAVQPVLESRPVPRFDWKASTAQSLLYTSIMHTFNLGTEAGTRDTMNGPWLRNYLDSVSELRGWSDSDMFMSPYVGHTIEGSVFGYIQRQNDPRYYRVQWGDGREYFMSLLHSMAYSAVWHTQWKIGPMSEASIGNVMLHASPGFITLTDTPTLGTVAMMGEDAADRYLIMGLENRTANRMLIILARSFLNPGRSFANLMAFQVPWHRETRIGVFGENFRIRQQLLADYKFTGDRPFHYVRPERDDSLSYPNEASIELEAFPVFEGFLDGHFGPCVGGGGSGAARVNPQLQVVAEVSGCMIMGMPSSNQSGDSLFYAGGLRWTPRAAHRISPYLQSMFGGKKVTHETDNIPLRTTLMQEWNDGNGTLPHYPKRSDWSVEDSRNGPSLGLGGGFDVVLTRPFAWRAVQFEYNHTWITDPGMIHPQNTLRVETGAVLRIGTW